MAATELIKFQSLDLHFKHSKMDFLVKNFKKIYCFSDIQTFWQVYNNLDFNTLIGHGSLHLSSMSPLWEEDKFTTSFMLAVSEIEPAIVWRDFSLFFLTSILNKNSDVFGISLALKGYKQNVMNLKICCSKEMLEFIDLPDYIRNGRAMSNKARIIASSKPPPLPPQSTQYNNNNTKSKSKRKMKMKRKNNKNYV